MKRNRSLGTFAAIVAVGASMLNVLGADASGPHPQIAARPLTPQEIKDYALPSTTQKSGGLMTVGVGQPLYLEAQIPAGTAVAGITWTLTSQPAGSTAALAESPLPEEMPIYNPGDREVNMVAGRMLLVPDVTGQYLFNATVNTDGDDIVIDGAATAALYVGVGHVGNSTFPECALCHTDKVPGWEGTHHSVATSYNLDDSTGHFGERCLSCHTTGYDTAPLAVNDGFDDIQALVGWTFPETLQPGNWDAMPPELQAKANVQCESCHGPGSEHFGRFDRISVSTSSGDCAQCHDSTSHHNKNQEWNASRHAIATRYPTGEGRASCTPCHSGVGFIDRIDGKDPVRTEWEAIVCATCHDPHNGSNEHQVRTVADVTLASGHVITRGGSGKLCMNCHMGRREAQSYVDAMGSVSGSFGAHHGPQADILAGKNGYEFGRPMRTSGHTFAVEESCVACHLQDVAATDPGFLHVGGHTFKPGWDNGTPEDPSDDIHLTHACSECHGEIEGFDSIQRQDYDGNGIVEGTQTEIKGLLHQLALLLPPYGSPTVTPSNAYTKAERGALWNYKMVEEDGSFGIHNTLYSADLLKASIAELSGGTLAGDADNDCLPDDWEIAQFGSITAHNGLEDPDLDGVNNKMEYAAGTNPMLADSDADGFSDFDELHIGTNPNSADDSPALGRSTIFQAAEMVFMTETGKTYQVQAVGSLDANDWTNHGEPFDGTGSMMQLFISTRGTQAQFYRVVELP
jgi:hypothetical protein